MVGLASSLLGIGWRETAFVRHTGHHSRTLSQQGRLWPVPIDPVQPLGFGDRFSLVA
jgi:hypothetical protein